MKCVIKRGNEIVNELNSKKPSGGTKTIKPRKDFNNLKCSVVRPDNNEVETKEEPLYRTNIISKDEVNLRVSVKGYPSEASKAIDTDARRKEEILERNTEKFTVSFNTPDVLIPEIVKDEQMKVNVTNQYSEEEIKTEIEGISVIVKEQSSDTSYEEVEEFKPSRVVDDHDDLHNTFTAEINDRNEIWDVRRGVLIGYTLDHEKLSYDKVEDDDNEYKQTYTPAKDEYTMISESKTFAQVSSEETKTGWKSTAIKAPIAGYFSAPPVKEEVKTEEAPVETTVEKENVAISRHAEATENDEIPTLIIHPRNDEDEESNYADYNEYDPEYDDETSDDSEDELNEY